MNKVASLLITICLLLCGHYVSAQKNKENALHLKNGSIIYGKILENHPDSIIKIQDNCDNILVYEHTEIQSLKVRNKEEKKDRGFPYRINFNTGIAGFGGNFDPAISLLIIGTYHFNEKFSAGILSGIEYFGMPLLPAAGEFQVNVFNRNTTPYVYLRGGYGFTLYPNEETNSYNRTYAGGLFLGGGIGIKKRFSSEFAMTFSIGYRHQQTYESYDYLFDNFWNSDYERHYFYNRAAFRIGLVF